MDTLTITLQRRNILSDMMVRSHAEVAYIIDDRERYVAELGTEKAQLAQQCITDAATEVRSAFRDVIPGFSDALSAGDNYDTSDIVFAMAVSARKRPGLADSLAKAIHAYIVDSALGRYYGSVSRPDLAKSHLDRLQADLSVISGLVYRKLDPTYQ